MRLLMFKNRVFPIIIVMVLLLISCGDKTHKETTTNSTLKNTSHVAALNHSSQEKGIIVGADRKHIYLPLLEGKQVGIVANQTSVMTVSENSAKDTLTLENTESTYHIVDYLDKYPNITVRKVFAPEHGFRGTADAGEVIKDGVDTKTGIPIVSLYGSNKKPTPAQLSGLDLVLFDIQDVGARFYTYISSLHYVMEACAEAGIPLIILDRPNPNGHYIDGPILETEHQSFVGMHPVPIVHGMTIGEYAKMINGEGWLKDGLKCDIKIIMMENYEHQKPYSLPIKPSPNLPNDQAINLYPSLCFFEGTNVNAGRGTSKQFQIYGSPFLDKTVYDFKYIPMPNAGAKHPKHDGVLCYGEDLSDLPRMHEIDLSFLIRAYENSIDQKRFFNDFFTKLAGTQQLQQQIETGVSEVDIKESWRSGLEAFKKIRSQYLMYR